MNPRNDPGREPGIVDRQERIAFRPLAVTDLLSVQRWLADPDVAAWWREADLGLDAIVGKYKPMIDGTDPVRGFVIVIDGADAGFIQAYVIADHPVYARQMGVPLGAVATDLYLGEPSIRSKGWAVPMLQAYHRRIVFGEMAAKLAVIAPEPGNRRAIHVYRRVGFRWLKIVYIDDPEDPNERGYEYVMVMTPEDFASGSSGQNG